MNILYLSEDYSTSKVHHEILTNIAKLSDDFNLSVFHVLRHNTYRTDIRKYFKEKDYKELFCSIEKNKLKYYKFIFPYKIARKFKELSSLCNLNEINLIHAATLFSDGALAYKIYKQYGIPYVVAIRGTDMNLYFKYMMHLWNLGNKILQNAQKIILISPAYLEKANRLRILTKDSYKALNNKNAIIPNGIEDYWLDHIVTTKKRSERNNILYIGVFDNNKNVQMLMDAVCRLRYKYPDIHLTLVGGGGNQEKEIISRCNEHCDIFSFKGKIFDKDELRNKFEESDVFAMISHSETFGLVYLEALSQGLPVLYSRGEGIDGFFKEKIGEGTDSKNLDNVTECLDKLLGNISEYETATTKLPNFSWRHISEQYIDIYKHILQK